VKHLLAIGGSYRSGGITDQAIDAVVQAATAAGARVDVVQLRDYPIEFCRNCRACSQAPGDAPGTCVLDDRMQELIDRIEVADGYILASPTNFYSVTALFKRFMERLVPYAWWPWGAPMPKFRKRHATKPAVLIAACAAPGVIGRLVFATLKHLRMTAKTIGAKPVGSLFIGLASREEHPVLAPRTRKRLLGLGRKLAR
jgi:multimeric flavodoxin WrbA